MKWWFILTDYVYHEWCKHHHPTPTPVGGCRVGSRSVAAFLAILLLLDDSVTHFLRSTNTSDTKIIHKTPKLKINEHYPCTYFTNLHHHLFIENILFNRKSCATLLYFWSHSLSSAMYTNLQPFVDPFRTKL
jgi:hypothetical protein